MRKFCVATLPIQKLLTMICVQWLLYDIIAISAKGHNSQTENFGNWEFGEGLNPLCPWFSVGRIIHDVFTAIHPEKKHNVPISLNVKRV